jgi:hypothetical protein
MLLKDSVCLLLTLVLIYLTMRLVEPPPAAVRWWASAARMLGPTVALFVAALAMHRFRYYVLLVLIPAAGAFALHALVRPTRRTPWRLLATGVVVAVMLVAGWTSRRIDPERVFVGHGPGSGAVPAAATVERRRLAGHDERGDGADHPAASARLPAAVANTSPAAVPAPQTDEATGHRGWHYVEPLEALAKVRAGFGLSGGHSLIDADVRFERWSDVLRYLPRGLANVLLTPYPWQWFHIGGSVGVFRALSVVEALLLYISIVPLLFGLWLAVRRASPDGLYLVVFVATMTTLLGLGIGNIGTVFRLRLEALLPMFTSAGLGVLWLRERSPRLRRPMDLDMDRRSRPEGA